VGGFHTAPIVKSDAGLGACGSQRWIARDGRLIDSNSGKCLEAHEQQHPGYTELEP
jgi:hypothetical protein